MLVLLSPFYSDVGLKAQANMQNIPKIFNKALHKSADNHSWNTPWNNPPNAADSCDFIPFKIEYSLVLST